MKYRVCVLAPVCLALQVVTAQSLITEDPADPDGPSVSVAADLLVGDSAQPQDLHVHGDTYLNGDLGLNGALSIGNTTTGAPASGAIRWTGSDFEGYDGAVWKSLTKTNFNQDLDLSGDDNPNTPTLDVNGGLRTDSLQVGESEPINEADLDRLNRLGKSIYYPDPPTTGTAPPTPTAQVPTAVSPPTRCSTNSASST